MALAGTVLSLVLLAGYGWLLAMLYRAPFRALGVLVAGMAFHNLILMLLLNLETPALMIRLVQFWKEGILLLLVVVAVRLGWQALRSGERPQLSQLSQLSWLDWIMLAFAALSCLYLVLPSDVFPIESTLGQRVVSFRIMMLMPLLYAFGRIFWKPTRQDLVWTGKVLLGSIIAVTLFGLWELWFVPTTDWLEWGVKDFTAWQGYVYRGPGGLPENFFQSTEMGLGLRRMVSTYISPLGLAYTGLLLVPVCAVLVSVRRVDEALSGWLRWSAFVLLVTGILFSVTRGALLVMVLQFLLLALLLRKRRTFAMFGAVTLAVVFILVEYVNFGPLVDFQLNEVRPPAGQALIKQVAMPFSGVTDPGIPNPGTTAVSLGDMGATPTAKSDAAGNQNRGDVTTSAELVERMISREDPSTRGHIAALKTGLNYVMQHPFGTGLGSSVPRFGDAEGPAESALLAIFGEMGLFGGLLYMLMYGASLVYSFLAFRRVRGERLREGFALVPVVGGLALIPIMVTSAIWGNFSVTFLFWWTSGLCFSLARERESGYLRIASEEGAVGTLKEQERDTHRMAAPRVV